MHLIARLLFSFTLLGFGGLAFAQSDTAAPSHEEVFMPMRDGVKLAANVFKPVGKGPWPVILMRTPYLKDNEWVSRGAGRYTGAGYVYVAQDSRGRGRSDGVYITNGSDVEDGYDSVEWLAAQAWSTGAIGITGGSAMGVASNLAAASNPPHLKAAYVIVAPARSAAFVNGVFKERDIGDWLEQQGAGDRVKLAKQSATRSIYSERTMFYPKRRFVDIPIYNVGGWYDIFANGTLENFNWLQNHGATGARGNQKLYMGPFGHGPISGDIAYPGSEENPQGAAELRWFEYWLKGVDNGIMDEAPVRYYMMASARKGALSDRNRFMTSGNWPPASYKTRYYLSAGKELSKERPSAKSSSITYRYDPAKPTPTVGGANLTFERGPMDQRAIGKRQDYLRFETPVLDEDVVIAGQVLVELFASTDGLDTDFVAKLVDVYPDGYEALVLDAPVRTRYRKGLRPEDVKMMVPGRVEKLTIDMWSTAITFEKGHRIALHITSSSHPRFEVNPNTGEAPGEETRAPRRARNTVFHDTVRPSVLILPVIYPN